MIELKPCPFCGGDAVMTVIEPHTHVIATFMPDYEGGAFIECTGCSAAISGATPEQAAAAWNRRASDGGQEE